MKFETLAIHGGTLIADTNQPVVQPITLSTTFHHAEGSPTYSRAANPNRDALENVLSMMEKGKAAAAFSSGNAAGMAVFQSLPAGSHVIAPNDMYHGMRKQLEEIFAGILEVSFVDLTQVESLKNAIKPNTKLLWLKLLPILC